MVCAARLLPCVNTYASAFELGVRLLIEPGYANHLAPRLHIFFFPWPRNSSPTLSPATLHPAAAESSRRQSQTFICSRTEAHEVSIFFANLHLGPRSTRPVTTVPQFPEIEKISSNRQ